MSAYLTFLTPMTDSECLMAALQDVGFEQGQIEHHDEPVKLVGFMGYARQQSAHIIIRKRHVGNASNDVGFLHTEVGYKAIVSDYDQSRYGKAWLAKLSGHYTSHRSLKEARLCEEERQRAEEARQRLVEAQRQKIHERAKKAGYRVKETREGEQIRMVLVKRTY